MQRYVLSVIFSVLLFCTFLQNLKIRCTFFLYQRLLWRRLRSTRRSSRRFGVGKNKATYLDGKTDHYFEIGKTRRSKSRSIRCRVRRKIAGEFYFFSKFSIVLTENSFRQVYYSVKQTCESLLKCIERYQDYICGEFFFFFEPLFIVAVLLQIYPRKKTLWEGF